MIPIELKLRNFMSYRSEELNFRGIRLACLAGDNGHGKSALLDAITWALWGRARTNSDDSLIHLGESEMEVSLEFEMDKNIYRVVRRRESKGRRGNSFLGVYQHQGEGFYKLAEGVRDGEHLLHNLMKMDYDTFINSAFILQGRANEFTEKAPADRKKILGDILGLGVYEEYELLAKEQAAALQERISLIEGRLLSAEEEIAQEERWKQAAEDAAATYGDLADRLREAEETLGTLQDRYRVLQEKQSRLKEKEHDLAQRQQDLDEARRDIRLLETRIQTAAETLERKAEIESGYRRLKEARAQEKSFNEIFQQRAKLERQRQQHEQEITRARTELESNRASLLERIAEAEKRLAGKARLEEDKRKAEEGLVSLETLEQEIEEKQARLREIDQEKGELDAETSHIKQEKRLLKEKKALLEQSDSPSCPLCHQPLTPDHQVSLLQEFEQSDKELSAAYRRNRQRVKDLDKERKRLETALRDLSTRLKRERQSYQTKLTGAESRLEDLEKVAEDLKIRRRQLSELEKRLAEEDYARISHRKLKDLEGALSALEYDEEAHARVRREVTELERFEDEYRQLQQAAVQEEQDKESLKTRKAQAARWEEEIVRLQEEVEALRKAVGDLPQVSEDLRRQQAEVNRLTTDTSRARDELTRARQQLDAIAQRKKEASHLKKEKTELAEERDLYKELQQAFGKRGVQALVIESAIPEIEAEANALLSRMTDGRMSLQMQTQRETKRGTTQETLNIILSDELGPRDYELFSGGEAFRADFALRVALSKLLARRAGAQLQTLIIDEGFGSQDAAGRQRLVEAINSIKDDFAMVLVITHVEELRDMFPVRINVVKDATGSHVEIM